MQEDLPSTVGAEDIALSGPTQARVRKRPGGLGLVHNLGNQEGLEAVTREKAFLEDLRLMAS